MAIPLYDHQKEALTKMHNGCILCGGVGTGKSRTGIAYYFLKNGGQLDPYKGMKTLQNLYIITTAKKRDSLEWEDELVPFLLLPKDEQTDISITIDSWNNISKYVGIRDAFFIFDEQRVVGKGAWVKAFLKITKVNEWILLSATPGDTWQDYIPVFIANGFYRNRTEFNDEHIIWKPFSRYPQVDRYINTGRLIRLRDRILIPMDVERATISHHEYLNCLYDISMYKTLQREKWDVWEDKPFKTSAELCYAFRKCTNTSEDRQAQFLTITEEHKKVICFYNYDYELDILMNLHYEPETELAQWNGHKHQPIPESDRWIYLVQYNAGAEGWNCIHTDTIVFYSQNYSYKTMVQAAGRIDRMNTPFIDLWYYHLVSKAPIDIAIRRALKNKKQFNERRFVESL